jgi:hemin uptake protein HemP
MSHTEPPFPERAPHAAGTVERTDKSKDKGKGIEQAQSAPAPQGAGRVDSGSLLRGAKAVEISHNGATYRLQATRLGKLILTK